MRPLRSTALLAAATLAASSLAALTPAASAARARADTVVGYPSWPMYHGGPARRGFAPLSATYHGGLHVVARIRLDGAVYASPLVVANGRTIVATENNTVYAFGPGNRLLWRRHLAAPSPQSQRPCGDIAPLGITSTPLYDRYTGLVYVAAEYSGTPPHHYLVGINAVSGRIAFKRSLDLPGVNPAAMQLRGALNVSGHRVWASFGALAGDCDNYKGRVVGVPTTGRGRLIKYQPSTRRQGGIWNPSGPTVDPRNAHLYLVSANGSAFPGDRYDHTNSVNEITPGGRRVDSFAPSNWAENNRDDVGLGSQGAALVGDKWVVLGGKSGPVYVLRRGHLGGIGGQVSVRNICKSYGGAAVLRSTVWLPCTDGVRAVYVGPRGRMFVKWHAAESITGSPVIGGGVVWTMDTAGGVLHGLAVRTGRQVASARVGEANRFATPALSGRRVLVGTLRGLVVLRYR